MPSGGKQRCGADSTAVRAVSEQLTCAASEDGLALLLLLLLLLLRCCCSFCLAVGPALLMVACM